MTSERESGVESRESEPPASGNAQTPDNGQPTTDNVRWPLLYGAVIGELVILILIFYAFTKAFS